MRPFLLLLLFAVVHSRPVGPAAPLPDPPFPSFEVLVELTDQPFPTPDDMIGFDVSPPLQFSPEPTGFTSFPKPSQSVSAPRQPRQLSPPRGTPSQLAASPLQGPPKPSDASLFAASTSAVPSAVASAVAVALPSASVSAGPSAVDERPPRSGNRRPSPSSSDDDATSGDGDRMRADSELKASQEPEDLTGQEAPLETTPALPSPGAPGTLLPPGPPPEVIRGQRTPCFPASANVQLRDGSLKQMRHLEIGDWVHVGNGRYSPVHMFTHRIHNTWDIFIKISTSSGRVLRATGGHLVYVGDTFRRARDVHIGDRLPTAEGAWTIVTEVQEVIDRGLYNPQTTAGDIVVDGIRASVYTEAVKPNIAHAALLPLRAAFSLFGVSTKLGYEGYPDIIPHTLRSMVMAIT